MFKKIALALALCAIGLESGRYLYAWRDVPFAQIQIAGTLSKSNQDLVRSKVEQFISNQGLLSIDLNRLNDMLTELAPIATVSIKRKYPDILYIYATENNPIALWSYKEEETNVDVLSVKALNLKGQVFDYDIDLYQQDTDFKDKPYLLGYRGTERKVLEHYQLLNTALEPLSLRVNFLSLNGSKLWFAHLIDNQNHIKGFDFYVGSEQILDKLEHFKNWYQKRSTEEIKKIRRVDLRYSHAFAVNWDKTMGDDN